MKIELNNTTSAEAYINIERSFPVKDKNQIHIHGKFNVIYEQNGLRVRGAEVLKHIILVATTRGSYQTIAPFKDVIIFDDDVTETENGCSGTFNINVLKSIGWKDGASNHYILCSIGTITSNILNINLLAEHSPHIEPTTAPKPVSDDNSGSNIIPDSWL